MRWVRSLFKFYLDASVHVSLAVFCLYYATCVKLNIIFDLDYAFFLFFATIVGYNFVKYGVEAKKYWIVAKQRHKAIQLFSILAAFGAFYCGAKIDSSLYFPLFVLTLISALYAVPFLPNAKNLRSLGGLKVFLVAFVWTGVTLWLPLYATGITIGVDHLIFMLQQFVLVLLLMVPFEIRDLKYDQPELRTIPQQIGVLNTKYVAYFMLIVFLVSALLLHKNMLQVLFLDLIWVLLIAYFINKSKVDQSKYFASFWVEAVPIFMAIALFVFKA